MGSQNEMVVERVAGRTSRLGLTCAVAVLAVAGFGVGLASVASNVNAAPDAMRAAAAVHFPNVDRYRLVLDHAKVRLQALDLHAIGAPAGIAAGSDITS